MTRLGNLDGRGVLVTDGGVIDVAQASDGDLPSDPHELLERWDELVAWSRTVDSAGAAPVADDAAWLPPSPEPRQIIAVGINSRIKLRQFGLGEPGDVGFISKLRSALAGPDDAITRTSDAVYVEAELALVVGRRAWRVDEDTALEHVAGVTAAADIADAKAFVTIPAADPDRPGTTYYNPAKSLPGFAPIGPHVVALEDVGPLDSLRIRLWIDGELVQDGTTADYVFSAAQIVSRLSHRVPLLPGDVILVGSPGQLDQAPLTPVRAGARVEIEIDGVGRHSHLVVADPA
ncbi:MULTISPECIES: fumarylacetoacetate hydrolase family protein [unclassified Aeromicrobium]|uniref:fumarylacetoacetate hydrolase family protein n=1 Tax=unclassified Aeromicrobium TaxID=2633570 RepID=UPI00396B38F5